LVEKREHSLLSLFELSHELSVSLDPYELANLALLNFMGHFGTSRAALWLFADERTAEAVLLHAYGIRPELAKAVGAGLGVGVLADPALLSPIELADWTAAQPSPAKALALESGLAVLSPIRSRGAMLGFLVIAERLSGEPYSPLDLEHMAASSGMIGAALENTRLYHSVLENVRQLEQANERMSELSSVRSQILQNVNHELRTPLAVVTGYLEILRDSPDVPEALRWPIETAIEQTRKLTGMVQNLLEFADLTAGRLDLVCERTDPSPLVRSWAAARRPGVAVALRELELSIEETPAAWFDAKALPAVLDALLDNAIRFTPVGTHIRIESRAWEEAGARWAHIVVHDDGPGIPPDRIESLFEPFRQLDGSTTRAVGGLGMGLALARQLVEKMGGRLECEGAPGRGTTFIIRLPAG
jgi:signal transduction histidine kinase